MNSADRVAKLPAARLGGVAQYAAENLGADLAGDGCQLFIVVRIDGYDIFSGEMGRLRG